MGGPARVTAVVGGVVVLAAWGFAATDILAPQAAVIRALADLLAALAVLLAGRFRRNRVALAAVLVAVASWLLRGPLMAAGAGPGHGRALLAVVLPLDLGLLAALRDRSLARPATLVFLGVLLVQGAAAAALVALPGGATTDEAGTWWRLLSAPDTSRLAFLVAALFLVLGLLVRRGVSDMSLVLVLAACAVALLGSLAGERSVLLLGSAQLALLVGLVEDSYRLAFHDELTGLPGRRAFNETLHALGGRFALAMVDVDHFKQFNDRFGHEVGDQVLRMVATELAAVAGGGRAFRHGGEEFAVVFAGRRPDEAAAAVERVRAAIEARGFAIRSPKRPRDKPPRPRPTSPTRRVKVTVSAGVAGAGANGASAEEVLRAADRALYRAKGSGRNRVAQAEERPVPGSARR
jgi:diguanylate cyclase (GGDEF)-like protein